MAWEWIGTSAVGGLGIFFTWLTGKQGRDAARADAKEAREQQRLENAYVDLLDMAERAGHWAQMVLPVVDTNPPQPDPDLPSVNEQAHTEALVKAFGSKDVRERMEVWSDVVKEMNATVGLIRWIEADTTRHRGSQENPRGKLQDLRREEREAREALGNQVAVELRHRT